LSLLQFHIFRSQHYKQHRRFKAAPFAALPSSREPSPLILAAALYQKKETRSRVRGKERIKAKEKWNEEETASMKLSPHHGAVAASSAHPHRKLMRRAKSTPATAQPVAAVPVPSSFFLARHHLCHCRILHRAA
jgi:hypothetical protein